MELFIAIDLEHDIAKRLHDFASAHLHGILPEQMEDLHITMRYLGHSNEVNSIMERLRNVAFAPFTLRLSDVNAFINPGENVVWHGLADPNGNLMNLRLAIERTLEGCDVFCDERPYVPHITLAFANQPIKEDILRDLTFSGAREALVIDHFSLCRVLPAPCPHRFQKLATYRLSNDTERRTVRLLCVNDFHAALRESSAGLGAGKLVQAVKAYVQANPDTTVLFGGDNCFGDPVSELYEGKPVIDMMHCMHTAASVVGNHDFDFPVNTFANWQQDGKFPMLVANLVCRDTKKLPSCVQPYCMLQSGEFTVALIGLATVEPMDGPDRPKSWSAYTLTDGAAAARKWVDFLNSGGDPLGIPDAIVALTHFGLRQTHEGLVIGDEVKRLAISVPELAGAFAAHWHQFLQLSCNGLPVAEGGSTGRGYAVLAITFDSRREVLSAIPLCFDLMEQKESISPEPDVLAMVERYYTSSQDKMGEVIATAETELLHRDPCTNAIPITGTPLSKFVTDVMRDAVDCPIAFFYSGRIGSGFPKGVITLYSFYQVFLFPNVLVTLRLTGAQIWENIEIGMRTLAADGASPLALGGLIVTLDTKRPCGRRVLSVCLPDGSPLDLQQAYSVVADDYLLSDPLGFRFSYGTDIVYHELTMRSLVRRVLSQQNSLYGIQPDNIKIIEN